MFDALKDLFFKIIKSRLTVLFVVMIVLAVILLQKVFALQIVNGREYMDNYTLQIEKKRTIQGTRGNIYDRNGKLLASNELSYTVTIEDNGTYNSTREKNQALNQELARLIEIIESNGDEISSDFDIIMGDDGKYAFTVEGTSLQRFRADVFGYTKIDDLKYDKDLGYNQASATAQQIVDYLCSSDRFDIRLEGTEAEYEKAAASLSGSAKEIEENTQYYDAQTRFKIMILRYALNQNSFQRYVTTPVASDVSDETVATVKEYSDELQGVEIAEDTKRVYYDAEYFSHIIGYTGQVSEEEYQELVKEDDSYESTDIVGRSGIEKVMEAQLKGQKGSETVYVNNTGKVLQVKDWKESSPGNDVYLSIDADLQKAVYQLLEQELAGILYSKLVNVKTTVQTSSANNTVPIYDAYKNLISNNVIDSTKFAAADEDTVQHDVYQEFLSEQERAIPEIQQALGSNTAFEDLSDTMQSYIRYIVSTLQSDGVFDTDKVDSTDDVYQAWRNESISVREYLEHAIEEGWIDISHFNIADRYADSEEVYSALISFVSDLLEQDSEFDKLIYESLIMSDQISGRLLCLILYEQGVLDSKDDSDYQGLRSGSLSSYSFIRNKVKSLEITPAQLALNPCTGSCVILDPNTGETLACVSYPGYDNNRLANVMDTAYYNQLNTDGSLPLYNNATQQTTAPGSTFKMVTATAGLTEGVITPSTEIRDEGQFTKISPSPKCWAYPSNHGSINVSEAIRDSCNYFFYEVAYRLSQSGNRYVEEKGVETIAKYAEEYGLGDKPGVEIDEYSPKIADEYPITMAIGQSNNNYTTIQLARYVSAVANSGTVYNLTLLNKVTDTEGNVLETYEPSVKNTMDNVADSTWDAIHQGMRMVVETHSQFDGLSVQAAGKTGTAQQSNTPNHALFVGYAPYDKPQIAIATRIANGYTSANSADLSAKVMEYYFNKEGRTDLLTGTAASVGNSSNSVND